MTDEKPRHKPQAKRTLEEVLHSLKDLVRNDLTAARGAATRAGAGKHPAADDSRSFDDALSRLDEIIDEKILKPGRSPPQPGAPEEIEIDWDDQTPPAAGEREAQPAAGAPDTAGDGAASDEEVVFLLDADALNDMPDVPADGLETIEAAAMPGDHVEELFAPEPAPPATNRDDDAPSGKRASSDAGTGAASSEAGDEPMRPGPPAADPQDPPRAPKAAGAEPPTLKEEIPVLEEEAPAAASPPGAPLPGAAHARDIAIRVIARINIERRRAGEAPLDIRTIERLQRYLADALSKAGRPK